MTTQRQMFKSKNMKTATSSVMRIYLLKILSKELSPKS